MPIFDEVVERVIVDDEHRKWLWQER